MISKAAKQIRVGGIPIDVLSRKDWAQRMVNYCKQTSATGPFVHFSVNGQVIALYHSSEEFRTLLSAGDGRDADGQSLIFASKLTSMALPERVATTDFIHDAAVAAQEANLSFHMLGSSEESISYAVNAIQTQYPNLRFTGWRNGYFSPADEVDICKEINDLAPDILWVGLGSPLQERFVMRNRNRLSNVKWIKTCGGLFDYFHPKVSRAPIWMQKGGLEWLYRTYQNPQTYLKRYASTNLVALWHLLSDTRDMRSDAS